MPHVVLSGRLNVAEIFDQLEPLFQNIDGGILKTTNYFLDKEKQTILIEALAIEKGKKTAFLALMNHREDGMVVRLYPGLEVEKTDGVKQVLAELAKIVLAKFPETTIGKTNLMEYLEK